MSTFWALYTGAGGGCDHTIDCNKTFRPLRAKGMTAAIEEALADGPCVIPGDYPHATRAVVLEVVDERWLCSEIRALIDANDEAVRSTELCNKRKMLEKLKSELGEK